MPVIADSDYRPPPLLAGGHLQTILPSLLRIVVGVRYRRERIDTPDGDFLDLDWIVRGRPGLVVLCHGLEGSSQAVYMKGLARQLDRSGWDVLALNYRGCSGAPNRLWRSYHSGATEDLATVLDHVMRRGTYHALGLVGFSLGGNLVLKFLGERGARLPAPIRWAAAVSAPCDLKAGALRMAQADNRLYMRRFMRTLSAKVRNKIHTISDDPRDADRFRGLRTFQAFDDLYTAPAHGFRDAEDYWRQCSARFFLAGIRVPTLLINARNDPFLTGACFPWREARASAWLHFEAPHAGGHVGFMPRTLIGPYWHERRIAAFAIGIPGTPPDPGGSV
jgi:predicted alpha/beta-fold hydrolase